MKLNQIVAWVLRILAALIMLQTLYFKFTGHPESIQIFSAIGMEPWGRYATGIMELIAAILILIPATTYLGAILGLGLMGGAIFFHLTSLGIYVNGDPGLFIYALIVFISCLILLIMNRTRILHKFRSVRST